MAKWNRRFIVPALAGALVAVLIGLALLAVGVLRLNKGSSAAHEVAQAPSTVPPPEIRLPTSAALPKPPLNRQQLLRAFSAAADAIASARPLPEDNKSLIGKSFAIRLPFGCTGPMAEGARDWAGWTYNPETKALKLRAQPEIWSTVPWMADLAGGLPFDAAEGFWIRRPWSSSQSCPNNAGAQGPTRNTVGIVQFFAPGSPRSLRRGTRPYAVTVKVNQEINSAPRDYGLLISGRVVGFSDGQPIHCLNEAANLAPICLIAVEFGRIAFEDVTFGNILSEWGS